MSPRTPRWIALVLLPLVAGALLLMHGLESGPAGPLSDAPAVQTHSSVDPGHGPTASTDQGHGCAACAQRVMVACVAVVTGLVLFRARGRMLGPRWTTGARRVRSRWSALVERRVPAPDPAWVRLSVMTC
ncbi:MAG: hypothetical protein ACT4OV_06765 [Microthrixaceae bacterium]